MRKKEKGGDDKHSRGGGTAGAGATHSEGTSEGEFNGLCMRGECM